MKRTSFKSRGTQQRASFWNKRTKIGVALTLIFGLTLSCILIFSSRSPVDNERVPEVVQTLPERLSKADPVLARAEDVKETQTADRSAAPLIPQPLQYVKKVLIDKSWNSEPEALGRFIPMRDGENEGAIIGPTAITCVGNSVYVLDNNDPNQRRLAVYDANGGMISSTPLPGGLTWADLVVDPSDSSLFVIDHALSRIYKAQGGEVSELGRVSLGDFSLGMLFGYDEASGTLYVRDKEQNGDIPILINGEPVDPSARSVQTLSPVWGDFDPENNHNILLNFKDGQNLSVAFDRRVESVDEMTMDRQGRVWVLFTLESDYRVRRLAVVDPVRRTAGVELLDIHFPFENIRRMAPIGNGVVILSGDDDKGRLRSYEYSGNL